MSLGLGAGRGLRQELTEEQKEVLRSALQELLGAFAEMGTPMAGEKRNAFTEADR